MTEETKMDAAKTPATVDAIEGTELAADAPPTPRGATLEDTDDRVLAPKPVPLLPRETVEGVAFAETNPVLPAVRRFGQGKGAKPAHPFFDRDTEAVFEEDATPTLIDDAENGSFFADDDADRTQPEILARSRTDVVGSTREVPVLRAEELWFVHDKPPTALEPGSKLAVGDATVHVLSPLSTQTFERRYRVTMDGHAGQLLLKQGAKEAPFVRYDIEARALEEIHAEGPVAGLPRAYAYGQDGEHQYIVTELGEGRPYAHLLESAKLSLADHVKILREVAQLVRQLHHHGYILTSLRPTSFDVNLDGVRSVFMTDFLNICETVDRPRYALASPFTAPEITELGPADEGADIYSIGALLYRTAVGADVPASRAGGIFRPDRPETRRPMVAQILSRTLSAPSERFFDVEELERALNQLDRELRSHIEVTSAMRSSTGINPLRIVNQDSGAFLEFKRVHRSVSQHIGFYCVADGMGGHEDGDRASELVVEGSMRCFKQLALELTHEQWREGAPMLCKRIAAAGSRHLVETINEEGGGRRMGTTFTSVLVVDERLALAHLGDSRAILYRDNQCEYLSEDHSLVGMMVKAGQLTIEQAERAEEKNILMRSVGADHVVRASLFDGLETTQNNDLCVLQAGDRLILVSDGVWGMIPRPDMAEMIASTSSAIELAELLCREAIARGGGDNVIVLALTCTEAVAPVHL